MPFDIAIVAFGLLTFILIATEIMYTYATQGLGFGFSSNRPSIEKTPLGLRIERTYKNQMESAAYVLPALIGGALIAADNSALQTAALIVVLGRALFSILFLTGLPFLRVPAFVMGSFGSLYILVSLALGA